MEMNIYLLLFSFLLTVSHSFINVYPKFKQLHIKEDPGKPLYLTPLIEAGKIEEARKQSKVINRDMTGTESYSGYLTVDKKYNSNMFFWFFPSVINTKNAPVVLWLQGGPGATSLFGLFAENGPFIVRHKNGLKKRKYTWSTYNSVLYIDNPVGTGYSFTENELGYAKNETDVGVNLYNALLQFFQLFPDLQKNDFYVTGESYAGKYVPAVSYIIHKYNPTSKVKINLQGLAMGNGFSDPINQLDYAKYLYQIGLFDSNTRDTFDKYVQLGKQYIRNKEWKKAAILFDSILDGDISKNSFFKNVTGFNNYYNYLISNESVNSEIYIGEYIQSSEFRKAVHVGNNTFNGLALQVELNLLEDIYQSVAPWISELLSHYRVLVYNGQLDIIVAYPMTVNYLKNLDFSGAEEYKNAQRHMWYVDGELAGYFKSAGNLTEILVRNAGHMVPHDQPKWALDLICRFTYKKPYF